MSSLDNDHTTPTDTNSAASGLPVVIGRVKWFNNKAGYGFITVTDGEKSGSDIFVHHSAIGVSSQQYKYLVQGEYVEFKLNKVEGGSHEFQAVEVFGIKNGKLMCETRRELKLSRTSYKSASNDVEPVTPSVPRLRGSGPREETNDWSLVKKDKASKKETVEKKPRGRPPRSV
jgi:cold shock CspA family protein